jgi:hypothetical protein
MGLLMQPATTGGKLFAGICALYSGLRRARDRGRHLRPVVHRFPHRFPSKLDEDTMSLMRDEPYACFSGDALARPT